MRPRAILPHPFRLQAGLPGAGPLAAIAAAPIITQKARCHNQTAFGKLYKESSVFCKISRPFQQKGTQPFLNRTSKNRQ